MKKILANQSANVEMSFELRDENPKRPYLLVKFTQQSTMFSSNAISITGSFVKQCRSVSVWRNLPIVIDELDTYRLHRNELNSNPEIYANLCNGVKLKLYDTYQKLGLITTQKIENCTLLIQTTVTKFPLLTSDYYNEDGEFDKNALQNAEFQANIRKDKTGNLYVPKNILFYKHRILCVPNKADVYHQDYTDGVIDDDNEFVNSCFTNWETNVVNNNKVDNFFTALSNLL